MPGHDLEPFANRLKKNARHFHRWAKARGLGAYRLYDRDIPGFPFMVDWYDGRVQFTELTRSASTEARREAALAIITEVLSIPADRVFSKTREPKVWGREQYERMETAEPFEVEEQGLRFWVELSGHLDTGLFLDHRVTRARVRDEAKGARVLNLFAYTGAFTVYAAAGGASSTVSVDLSNTYLTWAQRNMALNGLEKGDHRWIRSDARAWLQEAPRRPERFDLVVLDPPSFSSSKGMKGTFDVQRDQTAMLEDAVSLLSPSGRLYFSTHYRGFELAAESSALGHFEELTPKSIPDDFQRKDIHRCWRITR